MQIYNFLDAISTLVFIAEMLLFGSVMGLFTISKGKNLALPAYGKFMLGFSATPYLIGGYLMVLSVAKFSTGTIKYVAILPIWCFIIWGIFKNRTILSSFFKKVFNMIRRSKIVFSLLILLIFYSIFSALEEINIIHVAISRYLLVFSFIVMPLSILAILIGANIFNAIKQKIQTDLNNKIELSTEAKTQNKTSIQLQIGLFLAFLPLLIFLFYTSTTFSINAYEQFAIDFPIKHNEARISYYLPQLIIGAAMCIIHYIAIYTLKAKVFHNKLRGGFLLLSPALYFLFIYHYTRPFYSNHTFLFYCVIVSVLNVVISLSISPLLKNTIIFYQNQPSLYHTSTLLGRLFKSASHYIDRISTLLRDPIPLIFKIISVTLFIVVLNSLVKAIFVPIWNVADAAQYMGEATYFLKHFSLEGINSYKGFSDGIILANPQEFSWSSYLAYGLLHSFGDPGFTNDLAAQSGFMLSVVFACAALVAVLSLLKSKSTLLLGIAMFFSLQITQYSLMAKAKDGYRIIGVLFLIAALIACANGYANSKKISTAYIIFPFVGAAFTMMGHPLNVLAAVPIAACFALGCILAKQINKGTVLITASAGTGAIVGSYYMISALIFTGSLDGGTYTTENTWGNTPYLENYINFENTRLVGADTYWDRVLGILRYENCLIVPIGIITCLFLTVILFKTAKQNNKIIPAFTFGTISIFSVLMFSDLFKWGEHTLTQWAIKNPRYSYHLSIFFVLSICATIVILTQSKTKSFKQLLISVLTVGCLLTGVSKLNIYDEKISPPIIPASQWSTTLHGNNYSAFFSNAEGVCLLTPAMYDIMSAKTVEEFKAALDKHNITVILDDTIYRDIFWKNGPYSEFLANSDNFTTIDDTRRRYEDKETGEVWYGGRYVIYYRQTTNNTK